MVGDDAVDRGVEVAGLGHVEHGDLAADLARHRAGRRLVEIVHHHVGTVGREAPTEGRPHARAAAGDDDDLPLQDPAQHS